MSDFSYSPTQLIEYASLNENDLKIIFKKRRAHNILGFAYQMAYVRLFNHFPRQSPFQPILEILNYVRFQLDLSSDSISQYQNRRQTIDEHQEQIRIYLKLRRFGDVEKEILQQYILDESFRLDQVSILVSKAELFLREEKILSPARATTERIVGNQREIARRQSFKSIINQLTPKMQERLDEFLVVSDRTHSSLQSLKQPPGNASPNSMLRLIGKIEIIEESGILKVDLSWINNNFQRSLTHYAQRCSATRLRELEEHHRYSVLVCFLWQIYQDTLDHIVDMHDKIMIKVYNHAQKDVDEQLKKQRILLRKSLSTLQILGEVILNNSIESKDIRESVFDKIDKSDLEKQLEDIEIFISGKYSDVFNLVVQRFNYLRRYAPSMLERIDFQLEGSQKSSLIEAIQILKKLNENGQRKLPEQTPFDFIPNKVRHLVFNEEGLSKPAWECALLTAIRDEIKSGNLSVKQSKRFGMFENFFISDKKWKSIKSEFFKKSGLPVDPDEASMFLTQQLNDSYDLFLERQPKNDYAYVNKDGWNLSSDSTEKLSFEQEFELQKLKAWLSDHLRSIKLPELLIEVDNDLRFTKHFMISSQQRKWGVEDVCGILATIMAHGCNIGTYNMSRVTEGISYDHIKRITDWQLTEESQRSALAELVNAISRLEITQTWGEGRTSSSDGQRFTFKKKVLHQSFSPKFGDFALEFYSFVADNYAPFYSTPIECTDRDAGYVLDGLLYNESDLPLEEHFTDTHGFTEINFCAFTMLGRKFSPRIKGLHKQRIYKIDTEKDYDTLTPLLSRNDRIIHMDWICDQWDQMGHFYASLEEGHATASTALKRLISYSGKNHFYRANRELGRVFKTDHILKYMSDPTLRQRTRRGLLKGEQIHALARDVGYGRRGRINGRDLKEQKNSCSCLTLIMACIIYWQAKEINRVINEKDPKSNEIDLSMIEHISPIGWDNVILYGEYVLNRSLINLEHTVS